MITDGLIGLAIAGTGTLVLGAAIAIAAKLLKKWLVYAVNGHISSSGCILNSMRYVTLAHLILYNSLNRDLYVLIEIMIK